MQNQEIVKIIENLKGRRNYEEKKAAKLGFPSLYSYFEYKHLKKKEVIELNKKASKEKINSDKNKQIANKSCNCC